MARVPRRHATRQADLGAATGNFSRGLPTIRCDLPLRRLHLVAISLCQLQRVRSRGRDFLRGVRCRHDPARSVLSRLRHSPWPQPDLSRLCAQTLSLYPRRRGPDLRRRPDPGASSFQTRREPSSCKAPCALPRPIAWPGGRVGRSDRLSRAPSSAQAAPAGFQPGSRPHVRRPWSCPVDPSHRHRSKRPGSHPRHSGPGPWLARSETAGGGRSLRRGPASPGGGQEDTCRGRRHDHRSHPCRMFPGTSCRRGQPGHGRCPGAGRMNQLCATGSSTGLSGRRQSRCDS